jgi:hypothetical protein
MTIVWVATIQVWQGASSVCKRDQVLRGRGLIGDFHIAELICMVLKIKIGG